MDSDRQLCVTDNLQTVLQCDGHHVTVYTAGDWFMTILQTLPTEARAPRRTTSCRLQHG